MRTSNGFDRVSTPEELHQVLAVLDELGRSNCVPLGGNLAGGSWVVGTPFDDADDAESLAEFVINSPELKN
jgi:hypothetical protein